MAPSASPERGLGFVAGNVVQEYGWGDDVDDDLRAGIEDVTGEELADEDYGDVVDGVIIWYRDGDEDLTDLLVDVLAPLEEGGRIWLLTPRPGRPGAVTMSDVEEAATTAGLRATTSYPVAPEWSGCRLVPAGRGR